MGFGRAAQKGCLSQVCYLEIRVCIALWDGTSSEPRERTIMKHRGARWEKAEATDAPGSPISVKLCKKLIKDTIEA